MGAWVVEVLNAELEHRAEYSFDRSPVRIGRSPLNELPLPYPFVSHSHGLLHLAHDRVEYVDLGSTNGTYLADVRLPRDVPTWIGENAKLRIGVLQIRVRESDTDRRTHHSYAFTTGSRADSPVSGGPPQVSVSEAYTRYRDAWQTLLIQLKVQYAKVPPSHRDTWVSAILAQHPELPQELAFRTLIGTSMGAASTNPAMDVDTVAKLAARMLGPKARVANTAERDLFMERLSAVTEHCIRSFIELRSGHEQFLEQLGISVARETGKLATLPDAEHALQYLLDPAGEPGRVDELCRAFADVMTHQVAVLNAALAGAKALLREAGPAQIELDRGGILRWAARFVGYDARWNYFRRIHADLQEDKMLSLHLFGRDFSRAYTAIMGRRSADGAKSVPSDTVPVGLSK